MKTLNLSAKIAVCFGGVAVLLAIVAMCCTSVSLENQIFGVAIIVAAIGALVLMTARMLSKKGLRAKFITGAVPVALVYFIVTMLRLTFFMECETLGWISGILMCVAGVYGIVAFVLFSIDDAKADKKLKGEA